MPWEGKVLATYREPLGLEPFDELRVSSSVENLGAGGL
jgi:hypothetical protein